MLVLSYYNLKDFLKQNIFSVPTNKFHETKRIRFKIEAMPNLIYIDTYGQTHRQAFNFQE